MAIRPKIVKLAQHIDAENIEFTEQDAEYYGIECVVSDEQADILLNMKLRTPYTAEALARKCGLSGNYVREQLDDLAWKGMLEYRQDRGCKEYILPIFVPGSMECMVMNRPLVEKYPQIARAFEVLSRRKLGPKTPMVPVGGAGIGMHVIPVEKAIQNEPKAASIEQLSHWLKKYDYYAVGDCSCRVTRRIMGEGCGHLEKDMCIGVGEFAKYGVETGKARRIDYDEVMEILQRAEDNGLVHQVTNIDGSDKIFGICNCCRCSCFGLRTSQMFGTPNLSRSNYVAEVDPEKCVACGSCVETCPANAVKLGQRIESRTPVEPPKARTADDHAWSEKDWNLNYRDSKVNVLPTGTSPCKANCPAHIAVQGYLKLAALGRYQDALELIRKENPFPAICGRVCNRKCEFACTRGDLDEPLAIDEVKKFIAEQDLKSEHRFVPKMVNQTGEPFPEKIAIIGSGPAGLSCAYYLACRGYSPTVFEREAQPGGMMMLGIPSFRLEKDVVRAEIDILRELGVEFRCGVEVGKDVTLAQLRAEGYRAFYVAVGLQGTRKPGVPGEDAGGVLAGLDFVKRVNAGEEIKLAGKVVVIGGGNIASDIARTAVRCGAESVDLYCLESEAEMPMGPDDRAECEAEGISLHPGWGPKEFTAADGRVTGAVFKKCTAVKDADGRFAPQFDEADTVAADADWVLLCIGQCVVWGELLKDTGCVLGRGGSLAADGLTWQTGEPDIFAGGDAVTGQKFCIDAIAEGKQAAESLHRFVHPGQSLTIGRDRRVFTELNKDEVVVSSYDNTPRQKPAMRAGDARETLRDLRGTFTEEQVKKETERCLKCGRAFVDQDICLGCGVCTTRCKMDAITLTKKFDGKMVPYEKMIPTALPYALKRKIHIKKVERTEARAAQDK